QEAEEAHSAPEADVTDSERNDQQSVRFNKNGTISCRKKRNDQLSVRNYPRIVDYLAHAGSYYCLDSHNIDLRNYEAEIEHWPIRYRADFNQRADYELSAFHGENALDVILTWDGHADLRESLSESYRQVYSHGRLQVFFRKSARSDAEAERQQ
ncbi:MAG TPA: hypothetical protein VKU02_21480, partial [Gemmataceae bacterium]|nr:hypothetical protein [Gemmataceae bacterium]